MSHGWSESVHPRVPAGSSTGGQFASKGYKYPSPTESGVYDTLYEDSVKILTREFLHKEFSRDELSELSGARPGDSVSIISDADIQGLKVMVTFMGDDGFPIGSATRGFTYKTIHNEEIELQKGFRGKGLGVKIFGQQVDAAVKQGFQSMEAHAVGYPSSSEFARNGYYTWARFGYDGVLDHGYGPNGEKTVHEVMASPDGAAWWQANGSAFMGTFSLQEGSTSRRVFEEYRRLKSKV